MTPDGAEPGRTPQTPVGPQQNEKVDGQAGPVTGSRGMSPAAEISASLTSRPSLPPYAGWLVGIVFGVLIGLWALPPVRYTLGSQLQFALITDGAPWMRALEARRTPKEISLLDEVAASSPDDYLLQVGRATALADAGGLRPTPTTHLPVAAEGGDRTLLRLTLLASQFPSYPGACAHLARYMMVERVRIQRAELAGQTPRHEGAAGSVKSAVAIVPRTIPATHHDVRLTEWALRRGAKLDPDNAFWPAMLATTYFAGARDQEGLRELDRVRQTSRWDAYIYEEVLGQWRLYSLAYGDHGAAQKIGPLSLIAFPHLREMRRMADLARWHAEQEARAGHIAASLRIRHDLARLGQIMRETAPWAYEALYGTEIVLIASTDGDATPTQTTIRDVDAWRLQAQHYLALLAHSQRNNEIAWLTDQVQKSCELRQVVDLARSDASFPGIPPGIPLASLFGHWMTGISLIQQALALLVATLIAILWRQWGSRAPRLVGGIFLMTLLTTTGISGSLLFFGIPSVRLAAVFLASLTLLLLQGLGRFLMPAATKPTAVANEIKRAERRWSNGVTVHLLALVLIPGLVTLALSEPILGRMHPVAVLLTTLFGTEQRPSAWEMLRSALLSGSLPLAIALAAGAWGVVRGIKPVLAAAIGLRRAALPAVTCLILIYLILMQRTLRLDTEASRALNEAAKNDRQWVLTHVEVGSDSDE